MPNKQDEPSADGRCSHVYLLRLWREGAGAPWRLSLREANAGAPIGFADLDDMVIFLLRVMEKNAGIAPGQAQRPS